MECSLCGKCCQETEMELSRKDIDRLEEIGYRQEDFTVIGKDYVPRLRNVGKWCFFYDTSTNRCRVYVDRPLGCCLYPAMYSIDDKVMVIDELCPMVETISEKELEEKERTLIDLLNTIDQEAKLHQIRSKQRQNFVNARKRTN